MRRFLIDTDTASDDAVALVMALHAPDVQVEAITLVAGNVPVDQGLQNALYTVELCGANIPVYRGASRPMMHELYTAVEVHGNDGMGNIGLSLKDRVPAEGHAVDVIIDTINRYPGEITLVTLGPLTNIALAVMRDPSIVEKVPRCVVMGGTSDSYGNISPVAEYNIWVDPEAAQIVFASGLPITMVGWDISRKYAVFTPEQAAEIRALGTAQAEFCMDIQKHVAEFTENVTQLRGFDLPDPIAMAVALDPAVATVTRNCYVEVETVSTLCRGQTVVDYLGLLKKAPNVTVVLEADRERFVEILTQAVCPL